MDFNVGIEFIAPVAYLSAQGLGPVVEEDCGVAFVIEEGEDSPPPRGIQEYVEYHRFLMEEMKLAIKNDEAQAQAHKKGWLRSSLMLIPKPLEASEKMWVAPDHIWEAMSLSEKELQWHLQAKAEDAALEDREAVVLEKVGAMVSLVGILAIPAFSMVSAITEATGLCVQESVRLWGLLCPICEHIISF